MYVTDYGVDSIRLYKLRNHNIYICEFCFAVVYVPFFTIIEFIGYIGWIKVAETLLNPWGDDDEDFQINYLIDRNFQVMHCYCRVLDFY